MKVLNLIWDIYTFMIVIFLILIGIVLLSIIVEGIVERQQQWEENLEIESPGVGPLTVKLYRKE